jgi:peptidoglycan/LPS O-acetylase OafA/YrhL
MALAVMVFHFDKWLNGRWDASSLQGRLGVYAVSIFFVLSGLTLTLVYRGRLRANIESVVSFYQKRFWRIFPLLWVTTLCSLILDEVKRPFIDILLNVTGLFGWVNPARDIATGAWSIGCELVFYAFFPLILWGAQRWKWCIGFMWLSSFGMDVYVAFNWFDPASQDQSFWWQAYVQVANHISFFLAGMWLGLSSQRTNGFVWFPFILFSLVFFLWPVGFQAFSLVYGWDRIVLLLLTTGLVALYFHLPVKLPDIPARLLNWLGLISYSLYLWHPIVFRGVQFILRKFQQTWSIGWIFLLAGMVSVAVAGVSYHYFERLIQRSMVRVR